MKEKNCSFYFGKNFSIFFLLKQKYMILKNKNILSFCFTNYFHYMSFFRHIFHLYNKLCSFYYVRLKLKGLGYRIVHISKFLIKIFFNRSNFFYIHLPNTILFRYKIRRLFFLSTKLVDMRNLIINLLLLKKYIVYRLSGLFYPRQIILLKPGKNKFR